MNLQKISLQDCPTQLRDAVEKELSAQTWPWELLSVIVEEDTPFLDKTEIICTHQAILCKGNTFMVLEYIDYNALRTLTRSFFTVGTLQRVIELSPEWMGLRPAVEKAVRA